MTAHARRAAYLPATAGKQEISVGKSIYRQNAAEYRSLVLLSQKVAD